MKSSLYGDEDWWVIGDTLYIVAGADVNHETFWGIKNIEQVGTSDVTTYIRNNWFRERGL